MADQFVYVRDDEFSWIPGVLTEQTDKEATVSVTIYDDEREISGGHDHLRRNKTIQVKLKDYPNRALPLQNVVDGAVKERADMIELSFLHEVGLAVRWLFILHFVLLVSDLTPPIFPL